MQTLATRYQLDVRVINKKDEGLGFKHSHYVSVEKWLQLISCAGLVFTNSFHTVCFSIIFQRDFIVVPREPNKSENDNDICRITELLKKLGLEERFFSTYEEVINAPKLSPIQWEEVNRRIAIYRQEGIDFLKQSLKPWTEKYYPELL